MERSEERNRPLEELNRHEAGGEVESLKIINPSGEACVESIHRVGGRRIHVNGGKKERVN